MVGELHGGQERRVDVSHVGAALESFHSQYPPAN